MHIQVFASAELLPGFSNSFPGCSTHGVEPSRLPLIMSFIRTQNHLGCSLTRDSLLRDGNGKVGTVSTLSVTLSVVSRLAIGVAVVSTLALAATLVLYFQEISIPPFLMILGVWGLPVAFLLGVAVVLGNVIRRRNN